MPLTQLDEKSALIVIDLQKGIVDLPTVHPGKEIVAKAAVLARGFRAAGLPVVLVNVTGVAPGRTGAGKMQFPEDPAWCDLAPELEPVESDILISKQRFGAFIGTRLDEILRQRGVTQIVLVGIASSAGVESTARSGYDHGYNVVLVTDAMTDRDGEVHQRCIDKIFPRLGETCTTDEVLAMLKARG